MSTAIYDQVQILPTKECRVCDQLIDLTAVCCPFCQASQPKQPSLTRSAFITLSIASAAIALGVIGYWADNRDLSNRDMSNKDINAPIAVSKDPKPSPNVDHGEEAVPLHQQIDISESGTLPFLIGEPNFTCSAARAMLIERIGASDPQSVSEFNAVYESSRSCRPYTSW